MINVLIASLLIGTGSYFLREGDLAGLIFFFFKKTPLKFDIHLIYTSTGIVLNLLGIYFWQLSAKSNLSYSFAYSLYLSMSLIIGTVTSAFFERTQIGLNFYLGSFFVILGITILVSKN